MLGGTRLPPLWVNPHLLLDAAAIHLQDDEDARPGRKRLRASAFIDDIAGASRVASRRLAADSNGSGSCSSGIVGKVAAAGSSPALAHAIEVQGYSCQARKSLMPTALHFLLCCRGGRGRG